MTPEDEKLFEVSPIPQEILDRYREACLSIVAEGRVAFLMHDGEIVGCIAPEGFPVPSDWKRMDLWR